MYMKSENQKSGFGLTSGFVTLDTGATKHSACPPGELSLSLCCWNLEAVLSWAQYKNMKNSLQFEDLTIWIAKREEEQKRGNTIIFISHQEESLRPWNFQMVPNRNCKLNADLFS